MPRERAQLILIAGIGIAVTFVALALVLNTVIYTQNLATRGTVDGEQTITTQNATLTAIGGALSEANYHDYDSYLELERIFDRDLTAVADNESIHAGASGTLLHVSLESGPTKGTQVVQESDRKFTSASGDPGWTMEKGAHHIRAFRLNVSQTSLAGSASSALTITVTSYDGTGSQTGQWKGQLYDTTSGVKLEDASDTCSRPTAGSRVSVDITSGTFNGSTCNAIDLPPMDSTHTINIAVTNGGEAVGTYSFVVDQPYSTFQSQFATSPYSGTIHDSPYAVKALYSTAVKLNYRRPDVNYTVTRTVAPEKKPRSDRYGVETHQRGIVYTAKTSNQLRSISTGPSHTVTRYLTDGTVSAIGPKAVDFDKDGLLEIPYVNSANELKLVDANNDTTTLAKHADASGTLLAVGSWHGGPSVFYANKSNGNLYRVNPSSKPQPVYTQPGGSTVSGIAVLGVGDVNHDGDPDLVFVKSGPEVYYIDGGTQHDIRSVDAGPSVGAPRVFSESERFPAVDGGAVGTQDVSGVNSWVSSTTPANAPLAGIDWNWDGTRDIVYAQSDSTLVVSHGGSPTTIDNATGPVKVNTGVGVA